MPGFDPNQARDYHGRWSKMYQGKIPNYILDKMKDNVNEDHKVDILRKIDEMKKQGGDTQRMYTDENGNYTPERLALHDRIVEHFVSQGKSQTGTTFILGGAPANGKSTLEKSGFLGYPKDAVLVNADDVKAMLPEYQLMTAYHDKAAAAFSHEESSTITKKIIDRSLSEKKDMVIDSLADGGLDKLGEKIKKYRAAGNRIVANYVSLDTDKSLMLAELRGKKTGRYVPRSTILEMNQEISTLVPKVLQSNLYDEFNLWDTNEQAKPRLVLSQKAGVQTIHEPSLYQKFLSKASYKPKKR